MKTLGRFLMSVLILLAIAFLVILFLMGAQVLTAYFKPLVFIYPTVIGIGVILVLLSLIPSLKANMLPPILIVSYILGLLLFLYSAFLTLNIFNWIWLLVGVLLCGFGIVPIAMIGCIVDKLWGPLTSLLIMAIATGFFRWYVGKSLTR